MFSAARGRRAGGGGGSRGRWRNGGAQSALGTGQGSGEPLWGSGSLRDCRAPPARPSVAAPGRVRDAAVAAGGMCCSPASAPGTGVSRECRVGIVPVSRGVTELLVPVCGRARSGCCHSSWEHSEGADESLAPLWRVLLCLPGPGIFSFQAWFPLLFPILSSLFPLTLFSFFHPQVLPSPPLPSLPPLVFFSLWCFPPVFVLFLFFILFFVLFFLLLLLPVSLPPFSSSSPALVYSFLCSLSLFHCSLMFTSAPAPGFHSGR